MSDREKVIKGLDEITHYNGEQMLYNDIFIRGIADDAIAMLKEQDAVTPYIDIDEAKCPNCKVKLTRQELIGDNVLYEDFFDYCPHCGRSVKWDE